MLRTEDSLMTEPDQLLFKQDPWRVNVIVPDSKLKINVDLLRSTDKTQRSSSRGAGYPARMSSFSATPEDLEMIALNGRFADVNINGGLSLVPKSELERSRLEQVRVFVKKQDRHTWNSHAYDVDIIFPLDDEKVETLIADDQHGHLNLRISRNIAVNVSMSDIGAEARPQKSGNKDEWQVVPPSSYRFIQDMYRGGRSVHQLRVYLRVVSEVKKPHRQPVSATMASEGRPMDPNSAFNKDSGPGISIVGELYRIIGIVRILSHLRLTEENRGSGELTRLLSELRTEAHKTHLNLKDLLSWYPRVYDGDATVFASVFSGFEKVESSIIVIRDLLQNVYSECTKLLIGKDMMTADRADQQQRIIPEYLVAIEKFIANDGVNRVDHLVETNNLNSIITTAMVMISEEIPHIIFCIYDERRNLTYISQAMTQSAIRRKFLETYDFRREAVKTSVSETRAVLDPHSYVDEETIRDILIQFCVRLAFTQNAVKVYIDTKKALNTETASESVLRVRYIEEDPQNKTESLKILPVTCEQLCATVFGIAFKISTKSWKRVISFYENYLVPLSCFDVYKPGSDLKTDVHAMGSWQGMFSLFKRDYHRQIAESISRIVVDRLASYPSAEYAKNSLYAYSGNSGAFRDDMHVAPMYDTIHTAVLPNETLLFDVIKSSNSKAEIEDLKAEIERLKFIINNTEVFHLSEEDMAPAPEEMFAYPRNDVVDLGQAMTFNEVNTYLSRISANINEGLDDPLSSVAHQRIARRSMLCNLSISKRKRGEFDVASRKEHSERRAGLADSGPESGTADDKSFIDEESDDDEYEEEEEEDIDENVIRIGLDVYDQSDNLNAPLLLDAKKSPIITPSPLVRGRDEVDANVSDPTKRVRTQSNALEGSVRVAAKGTQTHPPKGTELDDDDDDFFIDEGKKMSYDEINELQKVISMFRSSSTSREISETLGTSIGSMEEKQQSAETPFYSFDWAFSNAQLAIPDSNNASDLDKYFSDAFVDRLDGHTTRPDIVRALEDYIKNARTLANWEASDWAKSRINLLKLAHSYAPNEKTRLCTDLFGSSSYGLYQAQHSRFRVVTQALRHYFWKAATVIETTRQPLTDIASDEVAKLIDGIIVELIPSFNKNTTLNDLKDPGSDKARILGADIYNPGNMTEALMAPGKHGSSRRKVSLIRKYRESSDEDCAMALGVLFKLNSNQGIKNIGTLVGDKNRKSLGNNAGFSLLMHEMFANQSIKSHTSQIYSVKTRQRNAGFTHRAWEEVAIPQIIESIFSELYARTRSETLGDSQETLRSRFKSMVKRYTPSMAEGEHQRNMGLNDVEIEGLLKQCRSMSEGAKGIIHTFAKLMEDNPHSEINEEISDIVVDYIGKILDSPDKPTEVQVAKRTVVGLAEEQRLIAMYMSMLANDSTMSETDRYDKALGLLGRTLEVIANPELKTSSDVLNKLKELQKTMIDDPGLHMHTVYVFFNEIALETLIYFVASYAAPNNFRSVTRGFASDSSAWFSVDKFITEFTGVHRELRKRVKNANLLALAYTRVYEKRLEFFSKHSAWFKEVIDRQSDILSRMYSETPISGDLSMRLGSGHYTRDQSVGELQEFYNPIWVSKHPYHMEALDLKEAEVNLLRRIMVDTRD